VTIFFFNGDICLNPRETKQVIQGRNLILSVVLPWCFI